MRNEDNVSHYKGFWLCGHRPIAQHHPTPCTALQEAWPHCMQRHNVAYCCGVAWSFNVSLRRHEEWGRGDIAPMESAAMRTLGQLPVAAVAADLECRGLNERIWQQCHCQPYTSVNLAPPRLPCASQYRLDRKLFACSQVDGHCLQHRPNSQMTLRHRRHSCGVPRVNYDLTKRSFIMRSLYNQKSVLL